MSFLGSVQTGRKRKPVKLVLYGVEGVGKSTFASEAPSPIFLDVEGGTEELDVTRLPAVDSFPDVLAVVDELTTQQHGYQTLVVDTADWVEALIWRHVCATAGVKGIEDVGYGKGYTAALEHWRTLLARLDALRDRGMHIIILAHSQIRQFKNPAGDDYDQFELKLHQKSAGVLKEWPNALLFARYQTYTHTDKAKRTRAVGDGTRVISTQPHPAWHAKNRYGLPPEIELREGHSWDAFAEYALGERTAPAVATLTADASGLDSLMRGVSPQVRLQAEAAIKRANGDPKKLEALAEWLRGKVEA